MSGVRTLSLLDDAMAEEFAWRKKELHELKSRVHLERRNQHGNTYIRCAVALLYAHWEGFIKAIATHYLEYVSRLQLRHEELSGEFLALASAGRVTRAMSTESPRSHVALVAFFRNEMPNRSAIPWRGKVKTRSNLKSTVLREIVEMLGLDYGPFQTKEKLIDERLVDSRNSIAHGHYLLLDRHRYLELHEQILSLMQEFNDQIARAATTEAFRVTPE